MTALRHVHLMDPQLTSIGGHYFSHDAQLLAEVRRRGLPVSLYGRRTLTIESCADCTVRPTFTHDIFHEVARDPVVWPMENFQALNRAFLADLQQLPATDFSRDDLIYFPNLLQNQVLAIADWLSGLSEAHRPTVALMFRYLNHAMDYVQARANKDMIALYYRHAVQHLLQVHPRTLICADTLELAKAYRQITSAPVLELPNPMDVSALLETKSTAPSDGRPVVVYQGHTSPLRGFHFLPEIIQRCRGLNPRPRFVIQLQNRDKGQQSGLGPVITQLEALRGAEVELIEGPLPQAEYLALLARADIVLLPYTPTFYGHGSSGVFTEAASVGKVVVACKGTVPVRQGTDYKLGTVGADQWTPASMSAAVAFALQRLPQLRAAAQAGAGKFRQDNCARALWDQLFTAAAPWHASVAAA